jgi:uncharacterized protein (DUF427 family)
MPNAIWNNAVIAESERFETVEGNVYFPPVSIRKEYFRPSDTHTTCPWKGLASYYNVVVDGKVNKDAAWYYPDLKPAAMNIRHHVAFWRGVMVRKQVAARAGPGSPARPAAGAANSASAFPARTTPPD